MVLRGVEVFVDLGETAVDVPQEDETNGGGRRHHARLLVLVQPLVAVVGDQLVLAETSVDKSEMLMTK